MAVAHDAICGGLARMYHLASTNADLSVILVVFARFEAAYASHADSEAKLLHELSRKLVQRSGSCCPSWCAGCSDRAHRGIEALRR